MCQFCSLARRSFLRSIAAEGAAGAASGAGAAPVILGEGAHRYRVEEGWGELPDGWSYGDAPAVCCDSRDNIYVFTRGQHPVIVFDRAGRFLRSWGYDVGFVNATAPPSDRTICSISPTITATRCASARPTARCC